MRRCKYFDAGHCFHGGQCRFVHSTGGGGGSHHTTAPLAPRKPLLGNSSSGNFGQQQSTNTNQQNNNSGSRSSNDYSAQWAKKVPSCFFFNMRAFFREIQKWEICGRKNSN